MKRLVTRATEVLKHFVKIDISDEMAKELIECYKNDEQARLADLLYPIIEEHGNQEQEIKIDFVGFE